MERPTTGGESTYNKVAAVAVVDNEDGPDHVTTELLQALNDTGFSIAANGSTYWVGVAVGATDYQDLDPKPKKTTSTTQTAAANTGHLARLLTSQGYPPA